DFQPSLERARDVVTLTLFGAALAPIAGATIGVEGLVFAGVVQTSGIVAAWCTWWAGDAMGILLFAPVLLVWFTHPPRAVPISRLLEVATLVSIAMVSSFLVCGGWLPGSITSPLVYVAFPLLLWAALS